MEDEKYPEPPPMPTQNPVFLEPDMPPQPQMMGQAAMPIEDYKLYNQALAQAEAGNPMSISALPHRPTITEMLQHKRAYLAKELEDIDKALAQAKANEGAMNLLDAIAKTQVAKNY